MMARTSGSGRVGMKGGSGPVMSPEPDDSRVTLDDVRDGVMDQAHSVEFLTSSWMVARFVYTALLLSRGEPGAVAHVARYLGVCQSEVFALERLGKEGFGADADAGEMTRAVVDAVREVARLRGRFEMKRQARRSDVMVVPENAFGELVTGRLARLGISRREAADRAGVGSDTMYRASRGICLGPSAMERMCSWLGVSQSDGLRLMATPVEKGERGASAEPRDPRR